MTVRFPDYGREPGLGVGLDLPWDGEGGFVRDPAGEDRLAERVHRFFEGVTPHGHPWSHVFFSLQPRDRSVPRLETYRRAWDDAIGCLPTDATRALHTTALDLGAARPKSRGALLSLVDALVERHDLRWVNEDLGLWSLGDRPLPYPLPPYLTTDGLGAAICNVRECQRSMSVPLVIEFPGFAKGVSLPIGDLDAYDFFRLLAEETAAPVTLDVGHLLSWRWLRGHRGQALYDDLESLPLFHCFEIHLSGCEVVDDVFFDLHHGVLLDEQLALLQRLLEACPNLHAVTYEDPAIDDDGTLAERCRPSLDQLVELLAEWEPRSTEQSTGREPSVTSVFDDDAQRRVGHLDEVLERLVSDEHARESFFSSGQLDDATGDELRWLDAIEADELGSLADLAAENLLARGHAGTGTLAQTFTDAFAAWREREPDDTELLGLAKRFHGNEGRRVREGMSVAPGMTLEEAFAEFAIREELGDPLRTRVALAKAIARAIVTSDELAFVPPAMFRDCPAGLFTVIPTSPPMLVAALGARVVEGPITALLATLVDGATVEEAARSHDVEHAVAEAAAAELARMGLRAP